MSLARVLHQRRPAVVVADEAQHACLARRPLDGRCFARIAADRLFAQDVFARRRGSLHHLQMQKVGRRDIDHFHFRIGHHGAPIRRPALEAQAFLRLAGARFHIVGADDQTRLQAAVRKTFGNLPVRAAVLHAHPTHADDADSDDSCHTFSVMIAVQLAR